MCHPLVVEPVTRRKRAARRPPRARSAAIQVPPKSAALDPAATRQFKQLPEFAPLLEEIELAGWRSHRRRLSGNFYDWMLLADGRVLVVVGQTGGPEFADATHAALLSQAAWATIRAHALHARDAGALLSLTAKSLWPMPGAIQHVSAAVALVDPVGGLANIAISGGCQVWRVRAAATEQLTDYQPPLGTSCDFAYRSHVLELSLRERLILVADEPAYRKNRCVAALESAFTHLSAESHRRMTAVDAVAMAREQFDDDGEGDAQTSASIIAVRRR